MSSWKRNPSRAIKFKTAASGIGSFELHVLETWWVSWRYSTIVLPCSCTCSSAPVSGHGWEGLLSQVVSLGLLCKTKRASIWPPSVPKAKMLLMACTFPAQAGPITAHLHINQGWLGGASWSAPKKSQGMVQKCTPKSSIHCLCALPGVLLWSCAVMVRIIFLGSGRFRKQYVQGSNPTWRHWITRWMPSWGSPYWETVILLHACPADTAFPSLP